MVVQYKCSNCGSDMAFDAESGMLHCDSCGNYNPIDSSDPDIDVFNQKLLIHIRMEHLESPLITIMMKHLGNHLIPILRKKTKMNP